MIRIKKQTRDYLTEAKRGNDTYDDVIQRLLKKPTLTGNKGEKK